MAYKGLKIKTGSEEAFDTASKYGIYVEDFPFLPVPTEQKNVFTQSWFDENGDDEFIPATPFYSPVSITVPFIIKGVLDDAISDIRAFINELTNKEFSFYDEYSKQGRQRCRMTKYSDSASVLKYRDTRANKVVAKFSIEIKINDPVTQVEI